MEQSPTSDGNSRSAYHDIPTLYGTWAHHRPYAEPDESTFYRLSRSKDYVQIPRPCFTFHNIIVHVTW
jgi:hypothetical protein